ncbi:MAG: DNA starvation/stationary phase protection protein [Planctomycetota bacterium]
MPAPQPQPARLHDPRDDERAHRPRDAGRPERVRALGVFAPASGKAFAEMAALQSAESEPPSANDMTANLLADHETLIRNARTALETAAQAGDAASEDLLTVRIQTHEKTAWMLRSLAA